MINTLFEKNKRMVEETGKYEFNTNTTDIPLYNGILSKPEYYKKEKGMQGKIVWMSPDDYIDKCVDGFWELTKNRKGAHPNKESLKKYTIDTRNNSQDSRIDVYIERWKNGEKPPMPTLEYGKNNFMQEGLHRALMAKKVGLESIPVFVVYSDRSEMPLEESIHDRLGKCYVLSYQWVTRNKGWSLVHGYITDRMKTGRTIDHAWTEKDGKVFDPVLDREYAKDVYYAIFSAEPEKIYNEKEVVQQAIKNKTYGPWHEINQSKIKFP